MTNAAKNIENITAFYNSIADDYNSLLTSVDKQTREYVKEVFRKYVPNGAVLDFGGGTGLDLEWMINAGYHVYFLEPSVRMRAIAQKSVAQSASTNPIFIDENLDFNNWTIEDLPMNEKMNGVIANFAVVNCIPNIEEFFNKITLICDEDCHMLVTVINPGFRNVLKRYSLLAALKILFFGKSKICHKHEGRLHETSIYTQRALIKAASSNFKVQRNFSPAGSDFFVMILSRK